MLASSVPLFFSSQRRERKKEVRKQKEEKRKKENKSPFLPARQGNATGEFALRHLNSSAPLSSLPTTSSCIDAKVADSR